MTRNNGLCFIAMILVLCHAGCRETVAPRIKETALEPPLKLMRLDVDTREMSIRLMPGVRLDSVVDLRIFGTFRPGMPLETIAAAHGKPATVRRDHSATYYGYLLDDTRIEVAHERSMSGESVWEQWTLYAYPSASADNLFTSAVAALIEAHHPSQLIVSAGDPRILVRFEGQRVASIRWYGVRTGDSQPGAR